MPAVLAFTLLMYMNMGDVPINKTLSPVATNPNEKKKVAPSG